jgi:hypothetical protein
MFRGDASSEIARLERGMRDAEERFVHAPGGLWLAASATIEGLARIDPTLLDAALREKADRLAHDARRMKQDGDARASQHELAALAEWVELARHRASHEDAFLQAALAAPKRFASRAELAELVEADERALEALSREPGPPLAPQTESLVASLRGLYPEYDPHGLPEDLVLARGREAQHLLAGQLAPRTSTVTWQIAPFPSSRLLLGGAFVCVGVAIGAFSYFGALARLAAVVSVGAGLVAAAALLVAALARRRTEMSRRVLVLEAWGHRTRVVKSVELARARHEKWVTIARTLGQLDAFKRSEEGVGLEAREHRLPALAPWVRTLVGGLDEDAARRFE